MESTQISEKTLVLLNIINSKLKETKDLKKEISKLSEELKSGYEPRKARELFCNKQLKNIGSSNWHGNSQ